MANQTERISMRGPLVVFLVLCLVGIAVAVDLTLIHVKVHTDPSYRSFCAISQEVNCDTVAESEYSVFLGLPVSVWGLVGYLLMTVLVGWGLRRSHAMSRAWPSGLLVLLSSFSVGVAVVLAVISKLIIHSMCLMCMASWVVAVALLVTALVMAKKVGVVNAVWEDVRALWGRRGLTGGLLLAAVVGLAVLWVAYPRYWGSRLPIGPGTHASGVDAQGLPWLGAREPVLTVIEFSDYECPHCFRSHAELRARLAQFPEVRLVHRHFPLDPKCNPNVKAPIHLRACERALAAHCAARQGRFWEMNDALYLGQAKQDLDVQRLARQQKLDITQFTRCLEAPESRQELAADFDAGRDQHVTGTPWFVVDSVGFAGKVSYSTLALVLCAQEQGKFQQVREELLTRGNKNATAASIGQAFGLDAAKLQACVDRRVAPR